MKNKVKNIKEDKETSSKWPEVVVLVRHGQSIYNEERELINRDVLKTYSSKIKNSRNADLPLSKLGKKQAEKIANFLKKEYGNFDLIFYSPFVRAHETAEIIFKKFKESKFRMEERIREKEFGVTDGLIQDEIKEKFPYEFERKIREGKYYYRPIGGESYPDLNLRVWSFFTSTVREHPGEKILIVCHSAVMLSFRRLIEKLSEQDVLNINKKDEIKNCAVISYRLNKNFKPKPKLQLEFYNKIA